MISNRTTTALILACGLLCSNPVSELYGANRSGRGNRVSGQRTLTGKVKDQYGQLLGKDYDKYKKMSEDELQGYLDKIERWGRNATVDLADMSYGRIATVKSELIRAGWNTHDVTKILNMLARYKAVKNLMEAGDQSGSMSADAS